MDFAKIVSIMLVEMRGAGYLDELIETALKVLGHAGSIPKSSNRSEIASAIATLLRSELFDIALQSILAKSVNNGQPPASAERWKGPIGVPGASVPGSGAQERTGKL